MLEEINIVIGSWGSYNACNNRALGSEWLNLTKYESWADIVKELKRQLTLSVYQKNTRAVKFYQRERFEISESSTDLNTGEKEHVMERRQ